MYLVIEFKKNKQLHISGLCPCFQFGGLLPSWSKSGKVYVAKCHSSDPLCRKKSSFLRICFWRLWGNQVKEWKWWQKAWRTPWRFDRLLWRNRQLWFCPSVSLARCMTWNWSGREATISNLRHLDRSLRICRGKNWAAQTNWSVFNDRKRLISIFLNKFMANCFLCWNKLFYF